MALENIWFCTRKIKDIGPFSGLRKNKSMCIYATTALKTLKIPQYYLKPAWCSGST